MDKQKADENRNHAKLHDQLKFMGLDCIRLHGGERYAKSNGCVQCQKEALVEHRARAKERGEATIGTTAPLHKPKWTDGITKFLL